MKEGNLKYRTDFILSSVICVVVVVVVVDAVMLVCCLSCLPVLVNVLAIASLGFFTPVMEPFLENEVSRSRSVDGLVRTRLAL